MSYKKYVWEEGTTDRAKNVLGREILLNVDMRKHITKRKNINLTVMKNKLKKKTEVVQRTSKTPKQSIQYTAKIQQNESKIQQQKIREPY